ncbi:MAG: 23S rRNA (pseudouridine(1915)-N(3))-methyltransferase RlmH [bacterium]|nr:MAG: 23S rRNA (pseudouridine(1915)-N(3))-methyltransferase RlmH [bacterium]
MKVQILGIGRIREAFYREAVEHYLVRIRRYVPIELKETAKERTGRPQDLETAYAKVRRDHVKAGMPVALDKGGKAVSSEELAAWLEKAMLDGLDIVSFVIGGPHGLAPSALKDSRQVLSLSALTLPHQMARLVLAEQIYRALSIIRGEPYHK